MVKRESKALGSAAPKRTVTELEFKLISMLEEGYGNLWEIGGSIFWKKKVLLDGHSLMRLGSNEKSAG